MTDIKGVMKNTLNVKRGTKSRKKGTNNQAKSKQYILKHPEIYGIDVEGVNKSGMLQSNRVHSMINSAYPTPFKDLFAMWDIITMPDGSAPFQPAYLIQVKSKTVTQEYLNTLASFATPEYVKREIHVWKDGMAEPIIYKLN